MRTHLMKFISVIIKKSLPVVTASTVLALMAAWMTAPGRCTTLPREAALDLGDYNFIQYEKNELQLHNTQSRWDELFSKFEQLAFSGEGRISIVHIGGSHVQGGFLSDKLRKNFQDMVYGAAGERGFVFPYELAKTNSPRSIKCTYTGKWQGCRNALSTDHCHWGMSGINATTYDANASVSLRTLNYDSTSCSFTKACIYFSKSDNVILQMDSTMQVVDIKEHATEGYNEYTFAHTCEELKFSIARTDSSNASEFVLQGLYLGSDNMGITYNAIGVNGASTHSYLRCDLFQEQIETLNPDMVIFGIGVNDANVPEGDFNELVYEARYDSLCNMFLQVNPNTCFLFVTNNDTYYQKSYPNRNALKVRDTMMRLAAKYDGAVYDLFEIMGGLGSIAKWQHAELAAKDKIHLSKKGYELQADMMATAFREAFGNYLDMK
ncbi:MAG: GDSL-type esterase/lipase family protein [Flavobacteriales bacterium]